MIEPIGDLLAFDPGARHPAAALFRAGVLISAERITVDPSFHDLPPVDRSVRVAGAAIRWAMARNAEPWVLVCEHPQVYRAAKSKGDPNDLVLLATINGALAGALSMAVAQRDVGLVILSPTPAEWIGQTPKSTTGDPWASARGVRIRERLSADEVQTIVVSHDAIDAVGIGLWALGRLTRRRVFAGATS